MEINALIERINELSRKQRTVGLEDWERAEQEALRQHYLGFIRGQVRDSLSQVKGEQQQVNGEKQ
jgi:uncharacterized protein YnzC (UPF0291/DUF896 family)